MQHPPAIRDLLINVMRFYYSTYIEGGVFTHVLFAIHHHHAYNNPLIFKKKKVAQPFFFPVAFSSENSSSSKTSWLEQHDRGMRLCIFFFFSSVTFCRYSFLYN
ncbi:hypothetical protein GHT06_018217 [Daphnia sinensis]|uniref:Uncharacterized protein n=1 Tax=Daphnia sinensis TaxID=1820382 RepID=A0AAD5KM84_9CRUS|nr:hypothetical protein GHT06_018217 [Daphnia sinensis]